MEPKMMDNVDVDNQVWPQHSPLIDILDINDTMTFMPRPAWRRKEWRKWNRADRLRDVPVCLGVYAVYDLKTNRLMYVGSGNVAGRVREWLSKRKWSCYVKWRVARSRGEHLQAEFRLIWRLQPPLNVRGIYKERTRPIATRLTGEQVQRIREETDEAKRVTRLARMGRKKRGVQLDIQILRADQASQLRALDEYAAQGEKLLKELEDGDSH